MLEIFGANLFMAVCMWIFLPICYVSMCNNAVAKNNLILSVTLPPEGQRDQEVLDYCAAWKKKLRRDALLLTVILILIVLVPRTSVSFMLSMTWLLAAMVTISWRYGMGYKDIRELKRRRGWQIPTAGQSVAELRPMQLPKRLKTGWFVPPMILSLLPLISCVADEWEAGWSHILVMTAVMNFVLTALSLLFYGLIFRQKKDVLDDDLELSAALTRVRRHNWTKTWLLFSWLSAFYSLATWLCQGNYNLYFLWSMVFAVALVAICIATEFATRHAQQRLTQGRDRMPIVDEDEYWIWGQFYYNPNSNKLMMNERVGMGMGMNYGHPVGKAMAVLVILVLLSLPALGGWMMALEMTPSRAEVTEDTLIVSQLGSRYEVELDEIKSVKTLEELPYCTRTWGTGMPNLLKGNFVVEGYGACTLCLDPTDPPFLVVKTINKTYLFGVENLEVLLDQLPE